MKKYYLNKYFIPLCLISLVVLPYIQTGNYDFVSIDDYDYILRNSEIRAGLTSIGMLWAFRSFHMSNWHPLTWLSHMLDVTLFGMDPGRHHMMNVLYHCISTALLYVVLHRMTGALWRSAFVAALFGIHPLHVESVAWIAERKDVLSGLFFMLVLLAYERYARCPGLWRYLLVVALFALGLMAKPMLVTAPIILLLLDWWPLGRTAFSAQYEFEGRPLPVKRLIFEKLPLVLLVVASSAVTFIAQHQGESVVNISDLPFTLRISNAFVSYGAYLFKMIWPSSLAVLYPYPIMGLPWVKVWTSVLALTGISLIALRQWRQRPFLLVGWLWYLAMMVPVIGLVQVGSQAMSDRYTYLPLIGPFVMVAWLAKENPFLTKRLSSKFPGVSAGTILLVFGIVTFLQVRHWHDSLSLFSHAISVTKDNAVAHSNLGLVLADKGRNEEATFHFREALAINPQYVPAHNNLGIMLYLQGNYDEAKKHFQETVRLQPDYRLDPIGLKMLRGGNKN